MEERMVVDAQDLYCSILEELPNKRGAVYYALSMVLEMIERMKEPIPEMKKENLSDCDECEYHSSVFEISIEAYGLEDLRNQLSELYEYTYSEEFQTCLDMGESFEYDSQEKGVHFGVESDRD